MRKQNTIEQYNGAKRGFAFCLDPPKGFTPRPDLKDFVWLDSIINHYMEQLIIEDIFLDAMFGLA